MIGQLTDAISLALSDEFNEVTRKYGIYTGKVEQGLKTPAFFIRLLNPTNEREMNNRYMRSNQFAIQYHPKTGREEYGEVIERLFLCLQNIKSLEGTTFEASNMTAESQSDDALTFIVNYSYYIYVPVATEEALEGIEINQTARS